MNKYYHSKFINLIKLFTVCFVLYFALTSICLAGNPTTIDESANLQISLSMIKESGDDQYNPVWNDLTEPLVVKVTDKNGNGIGGASITFSIDSQPAGASGAALLEAPHTTPTIYSTTTNSDGIAETTLQFGDIAGSYLVSATATDSEVAVCSGVIETFTVNTVKVEFDTTKVKERDKKLEESDIQNRGVKKSLPQDWEQHQQIELGDFLTNDSDKNNIKWFVTPMSLEVTGVLIPGTTAEIPSSTFDYGPSPSADQVNVFEIEAIHKFCSFCSDRMYLVVIPQSTKEKYANWYINELKDITWHEQLPAIYLELGDGKTDPEFDGSISPSTLCNPDLWGDVRELNNNYHPGAKYEYVRNRL